jgi:hypothetical protein
MSPFTVEQERVMRKNVSWKQISQHHLTANIAGQKIDLCYEFAGFFSGWKVMVDGVRRGMERELGDSKIMAMALVGSFVHPAGWLSDVELGA